MLLILPDRTAMNEGFSEKVFITVGRESSISDAFKIGLIANRDCLCFS